MLRRHLCGFAILLAVSAVAGATDVTSGDESHGSDSPKPSASILADSTNSREDSTTVGTPDTTRRRRRAMLPPPRFKQPEFFTTRSEIDFERGVVVTTMAAGGVRVGAQKIQPLESFIYESIAERMEQDFRETKRRIARQREEEEGGLLQVQFEIPNLPPVAKSIIGEVPSTLHITGYGRITMSGRSTYRTGETIGPNQRQNKFPTLAMEQELAFQINGTIGSKIHVTVDQDTRRSSDLDNNIRLRYQGEEDEVIQEIEAGNTNLSLQGSQFVSGGRQHSGLFGIKTRARFGDLEMTMIASQQKSSAQKKTFRGGAQASEVRIRDTEYLGRRFYFLDESYRIQYGKALEQLRQNPTQSVLDIGISAGRPWARQVISIELYRQTPNATMNPGGFAVHAMLTDSSGNDAPHSPYDPNELQQRLNEGEAGIVNGFWQLIPNTEYTFDPDLGYIDFLVPLTQGTEFAIRMSYTNQRGETVVFPQSTDQNQLVLKLVKKANVNPSDPTWTYEWRNVYYVGARDLDPDDFRLAIVDGRSGTDANTPGSSPLTYMEILKLDVARGNPLQEGSDGLVDNNSAKVDLKTGLVYLPFLEPFKESFVELPDEPGNKTMYESSNSFEIQDKYHLVATYSKASTQIQLGFNVLENSEVVKLNGETLMRNVHYTIDYFTGNLRFQQTVADRVSQPGADLSVDYEVNPFFKPDQESLVGLSSVYKLGERGSIGGIIMYNSERTSATRVRVGEEPTTMTVFSTYANYEWRPSWITTMVDYIPFVESEETSTIRLEGELAQSFPNLNTRGVAYVDDFEGAGNIMPIGLRRSGWYLSSPPLDLPSSIELPRDVKGKLVWFNPLYRVETLDVFDQRDPNTISRAEQYVEVFNLWFRPGGETPTERTQSWAGVMRTWGADGVDLQRTQFIEIWVRGSTTPFDPYRSDVRYEPSAGRPVLHIDLGDISENSWYSPKPGLFRQIDFNTEDFIVDTNYVSSKWRTSQNDGLVQFSGDDQGEDVGLDGCPDRYEDGSGGCLDTPRSDGAVDPNGDNWSFDERRDKNPYAYEFLNGTENNRNDVEFSNRPDTEDMNGNGTLDRGNRYISYAIELGEDSPYLVEDADRHVSGFRLYRIPLKELAVPQVDSTSERPSFQRITTTRLWISDVPDSAYWVTFASMDFVGNDWEELKGPDDDFSVTVVNTQDNAAVYTSPPGVQREIDPVTGIPRREQSLVLQFGEIQPGETYRAQRDLLRSKDFTDYSRLRMYVHGPDNTDPVWDHLSAFLRIGLDSTAYYELRVPRVYPGWDERNLIEVYLDSLTNLKLAETGEIFAGTDTVSTDGKMRIVGAPRGAAVKLPSLRQVRILQLGIINLSDHTIHAPPNRPIQVWFDDMRLDGVRNINGRAVRASVDLKMADLAGFRAATTSKDIGFGSVQDKRGSTVESSTYSLALEQFRVDKFLPPGWRVSVPVNLSYSVSRSVPRLKSGSDIELVQGEDKDPERTRSETFRASTSYAKTSRSQNPVVGMTLDRMSTAFTYGLTRSIVPSPNSRDSSRTLSYTGRFNYDLTPRRPRQVKLFGWLPSLMPDAVTESELAYLPTSLRFDLQSTFSQDSTWYKEKASGRDTTRITGRRAFTLDESYRLAFQPYRSVNTSYDLSFKRNLEDALDDEVSAGAFARAILANAFRKREIRRSQGTRFDYSPQWPWWASHSYSITNQYSDDSDPRTSSAAAATSGERFFTISSARSYNVSNFTFKNKDILLRLSGQSSSSERSPTGRTVQPTDTSKGFTAWTPLKWTAGFFGNRLDNFTGRVSYNESYAGTNVPASLRPDLAYQIFGIGQHPGLGGATTTFRAQNSITKGFGWDVSTGLELPLRMRVRGKYSYRQQRNFQVVDTTRSQDVTFPDLSYTWDGIEQLPLLDYVMTRSDLQSGFKRETTQKWTKNSSLATERVDTRRTAFKFSPLFQWNVLWKNNLKTTLRGTWDRSYDDRPSQGTTLITTKATNWSASVTAGYELQTSRGIRKFWGVGVWKLSGNVNFSFDASLSGRDAVAVNGNIATGEDQVQADSWGWSVKPRASYQFSRTFSGQAQIEIGATRDNLLRQTTHVRAVSVSGELRFN